MGSPCPVMSSNEHGVVIAGGGPTGLMLAAELALAGVDVAVVERRGSQDLPGSRAGGLHARTIEVLDQRGVAERFLAEGQPVQVISFAGVTMDMSDFSTRYPHSLGLWQNHVERILAEWVEELPVTVLRGREVTGLAQDDTGVDVTLAGGEMLRGSYLVGCDGGRSLVRKAAGIEFPGWDPTTSSLIAEAEMADQPELGTIHDDVGVHGIGRVEYEIRDGEIIYPDSGPVRVVVTERAPASGQPTLRELSQALTDVYGTDYGIHDPTWLSRFSDMSRQAASYRAGRVLLAGDAAHVHSPDGAQGMNTGMQDAVNLGWKLAQVVQGISPDTLLDTYHAERHPVGARVLRTTMASVALRRTDPRIGALRETLEELMHTDDARRLFAAMLSGLDVHYDLGEGHPLLGRRMPDLDLGTATGQTRVYELLRTARPVLLDFEQRGSCGLSPWRDRVHVIEASCAGPWHLPAIGEIHAPPAALIRPDGYVAWTGDLADPALPRALTSWFGAPTTR